MMAATGPNVSSRITDMSVWRQSMLARHALASCNPSGFGRSKQTSSNGSDSPCVTCVSTCGPIHVVPTLAAAKWSSASTSLAPSRTARHQPVPERDRAHSPASPTCFRILAALCRLTTGPRFVVGSCGSPRRYSSALAIKWATNASWIEACTYMRSTEQPTDQLRRSAICDLRPRCAVSTYMIGPC